MEENGITISYRDLHDLLETETKYVALVNSIIASAKLSYSGKTIDINSNDVITMFKSLEPTKYDSLMFRLKRELTQKEDDK